MTHDINNLNWEPYPIVNGERAVADFKNGYSASCLRGGDLIFCTDNGIYEIAVMHDNEICYDNPLGNCLFIYLSESEANKLLADMAALPKRNEECDRL